MTNSFGFVNRRKTTDAGQSWRRWKILILVSVSRPANKSETIFTSSRTVRDVRTFRATILSGTANSNRSKLHAVPSSTREFKIASNQIIPQAPIPTLPTNSWHDHVLHEIIAFVKTSSIEIVDVLPGGAQCYTAKISQTFRF
jgi:hypothetical protein